MGQLPKFNTENEDPNSIVVGNKEDRAVGRSENSRGRVVKVFWKEKVFISIPAKILGAGAITPNPPTPPPLWFQRPWRVATCYILCFRFRTIQTSLIIHWTRATFDFSEISTSVWNFVAFSEYMNFKCFFQGTWNIVVNPDGTYSLKTCLEFRAPTFLQKQVVQV